MEPHINQLLKGHFDQYTVSSKMQEQGKHGVSFEGTNSHKKRVFIKSLNLGTAVEMNDLKGRIDRLSHNFKKEYDNSKRLVHLPTIAHVTDFGTFSSLVGNDNVDLPFLVQEFSDGIPLTKYLEGRFAQGGIFNGVPSSAEWLLLTNRVISTLGGVHDAEVVHGDIHPGNILVQGDTPILIDFGQSLIRDVEQFNKETPVYDTDYTAPEKAPEAPNVPWEQPADIFAVGMLLFYMATGRRIPRDRLRSFKHLDELHDEVISSITDNNPSLLRDNRCVAHLIIMALHMNPHERPSARQLLNYLHSIAMPVKLREQVTLKSLRMRLGVLNKEILRPVEEPSQVILNLFNTVLERYAQEARQLIRYKRVEMSGDRTEMLNTLHELLSHLSMGDCYWTVTHPTFWKPYNLGVKGRFYDYNFLLAQNGVAIRRIFLYSEDENEDDCRHRRSVLEVHKQMIRDLRTKNVPVRPSVDDKLGVFTGVMAFQKRDELDRHMLGGYLIGLARISTVYYSLTFRSGSSDRVIRRLIIERTNKRNVQSALKDFEELMLNSTNILDFEI